MSSSTTTLNRSRAGHEYTPEQNSITSVRLTPREIEVLHLIAEGHSSRSAAAVLFLSTRTIEFHVQSVFVKLDVNSRMLALRRARKLGLLPFEP